MFKKIKPKEQVRSVAAFGNHNVRKRTDISTTGDCAYIAHRLAAERPSNIKDQWRYCFLNLWLQLCRCRIFQRFIIPNGGILLLQNFSLYLLWSQGCWNLLWIPKRNVWRRMDNILVYRYKSRRLYDSLPENQLKDSQKNILIYGQCHGTEAE